MNYSINNGVLMKKVLILCTGNSCRSIIAEALINKELGKFGIKAFSAGSNPSGYVNENAKKVLKKYGAWDERYYSKTIKEIEKESPFDLVITVCNSAKKACPIFAGAKKQLHLGFEDPDSKPYEAFEKTYMLMQKELLSLIKKVLL